MDGEWPVVPAAVERAGNMKASIADGPTKAESLPPIHPVSDQPRLGGQIIQPSQGILGGSAGEHGQQDCHLPVI